MNRNGTGPAPAAVVSGASTGIGEACALRLDGMGWRVFAGVRRPEDGDALRAKASSRLTPVMIDVTDQGSIDSARDRIAADVGEAGLAGLVNNAGVGFGGPLEFLALDDLRRQLEVNVVGQVAVAQAFLPLLRKNTGRIVNIGSIGGRVTTPFMGPYCASKHAMEAITDAMRMELAPWKMHVAVIEPGSIATPIWDKARATVERLDAELPAKAHQYYEPALTALSKAIDDAAKRGIPPDNVAKAVAHALTARRPKTRYLVGNDARMQALASTLLPDRMFDGLVRRIFGLPSDPPPPPADAEEAERVATAVD